MTMIRRGQNITYEGAAMDFLDTLTRHYGVE